MAGIEGYKRRGNQREGVQQRQGEIDVKWWVTGEEGSVSQACGQGDWERELREI